MKTLKAIYRFADIDVQIKYLYKRTSEYLSKYTTRGRAEYKIKVNKRDIAYEKVKAREEGLTISVENEYERMAILRKFSRLALEKGVLLFHASSVMVDGAGYVFAAPSGTGKSTHTRLWRKILGDRATIINDDKPFLRFQEGVWWVYGSPWNGKHGLDNNVKAPIKGICFLEQSAQNEMGPIEAGEGFRRLCKQIYFPEKRELCGRAVNLAGELTKLPMYLLKCNISEEAAQLSYHTMSGGDIE